VRRGCPLPLDGAIKPFKFMCYRADAPSGAVDCEIVRSLDEELSSLLT